MYENEMPIFADFPRREADFSSPPLDSAAAMRASYDFVGRWSNAAVQEKRCWRSQGCWSLSAIPCSCSRSRNSPALMYKNKTNQTNRGEKGGGREEWRLISCSNDFFLPLSVSQSVGVSRRVLPLGREAAAARRLGSHAGI